MIEYIENGSVTSVKGIKSSGVFCGLKKKKKDVALIYSEKPCTAAGTFTLNKVKAAPIIISQYIVNLKHNIKAVLINSGNANACTGAEGHNDALESQKLVASKLGINPSEVLISSTGVIGQRINMDALRSGIELAVENLSETGGIDAAEAIMTTDLAMKSYAAKVKLSSGEITIGAMCKGSGMIMPNMATMLAFITTDAQIEQDTLQKTLSKAVNLSFNRITVDGDTSTNDMVILLANGVSGISISERSDDYKIFTDALLDLCRKMAKSIAADGEGATKLITVSVKNAASVSDANIIAKAISNSPLVKTAMNGCDANWGRIISAIGNSGIEFDPAKVCINFGDIKILQPNFKADFSEEEAKKYLMNNEIELNIEINTGNEESTWYTCDFSTKYIEINASYRS